jgi:hypothetical protein
MLIPRDHKNPCIIIEFKKVSPSLHETLESACKKALAQIRDKHYAQELQAQGIDAIWAYGIAFEGKKIAVELERM